MVAQPTNPPAQKRMDFALIPQSPGPRLAPLVVPLSTLALLPWSLPLGT